MAKKTEVDLEISWQKFVKLPVPLEFGAVAVCPRCRGRTKRYDYDGLEGQRHKDPWKSKRPCLGCNGFGIIPNVGPIPLTLPEGMS